MKDATSSDKATKVFFLVIMFLGFSWLVYSVLVSCA